MVKTCVKFNITKFESNQSYEIKIVLVVKNTRIKIHHAGLNFGLKRKGCGEHPVLLTRNNCRLA